MTGNERQTIIEPERIRALTHPLRLRLLDLLREHGDLTATQCAELTAESVASCSFHLRMLEKYGFIERSAQRGKEKPWRVLLIDGYETDADPAVPGSVAANAELAQLALSQRTKATAAAFARIAEEPKEWVDATRLMSFAVWATAEEANALGDEVEALLEPFRGREQPSARPGGARRVHVLTTVHSDPAPRQQSS